jgi:predicted  nucleic acid-binding Zn-ribbon protein
MSAPESILNIETLDIQIARLENSKLEYPQTLKKLKDDIARKEQELLAAKRKVEKIEKDIASANIDLETQKNELDKSYERINLVKNNKEYDAVHREIKEREKFVADTNRNLVKFKEKLPQLQEELKSVQDVLDKTKAETSPLIEDLTRKIATIDGDISLKTAEKEKLQQSIPTDYLIAYNSILPGRKKSGKVLSIVTSGNDACEYCNQILSPNILKKMLVSNTPVFCENCGSLFVFVKKSLKS